MVLKLTFNHFNAIFRDHFADLKHLNWRHSRLQYCTEAFYIQRLSVLHHLSRAVYVTHNDWILLASSGPLMAFVIT